MIPEQIPVNNHFGNNEATQFDFDFFIENETQLKVTHTDFQGNETYPVLGVDYSIKSLGKKNGSYIEFPLADSKYNVLGWDLSTDRKELLTIELNIPIEQPAEYQMSAKLSLKNIENSFDYLTRICQILRRLLDRTLKVSESVADMNMNLPLPVPNNVFKWNETGTSLENYDIIGENNAFKSQLLSDIDAAQAQMNATINKNKKDTDDEISRFESETTEKIDQFKNSTSLEIITFEENTNIELASMRDHLNDTMTEYQLQTNTDIEDFKLSVNDKIATVSEAAEKIGELEDAMNNAIQKADEVAQKADEVAQKADTVETLANQVSEKADTIMTTVENLANKDLSNLSEKGEARFNAKVDKELFDSEINTLNNAVSQSKTDCENNLKQTKNDLTVLIDKKQDGEIARQIQNCTYEGINLEEKFADEIAAAGDVYKWLESRKNAGNFEGIHIGDYFYTNITAGSVAGYNIAAQNFKCRIVGINTYKNCGDNVIGNMLYVMSDEVIDTPIKWNPTDNNNGTATQKNPWLASAAYAVLNGVNNYSTNAYQSAAHGANASAKGILQLLPTTLQSVLKQKRMLLDERYSASGLLTGSTTWAWGDGGKLWLPNEYEVYGCAVRSNLCQTAGFWHPEAGLSIQFPWFANNCEHRIKRLSTGGRTSWRLSCPASYTTTLVCLVNSTGFADSYLASHAGIYLPLCFCI